MDIEDEYRGYCWRQPRLSYSKLSPAEFLSHFTFKTTLFKHTV
jgi:hypothetical protein